MFEEEVRSIPSITCVVMLFPRMLLFKEEPRLMPNKFAMLFPFMLLPKEELTVIAPPLFVMLFSLMLLLEEELSRIPPSKFSICVFITVTFVLPDKSIPVDLF